MRPSSPDHRATATSSTSRPNTNASLGGGGSVALQVPHQVLSRASCLGRAGTSWTLYSNCPRGSRPCPPSGRLQLPQRLVDLVPGPSSAAATSWGVRGPGPLPGPSAPSRPARGPWREPCGRSGGPRWRRSRHRRCTPTRSPPPGADSVTTRPPTHGTRWCRGTRSSPSPSAP
jgi:hypothetical protein